MKENPYHVLGSTAVEMLGRKHQLRQVIGQLAKPNPEHLSVVGPKWMGKSVFLRALVQHLREAGGYVALVNWDFRSNLPQTDEEFLRQLSEQLKSALCSAAHPAAAWLDPNGADPLGDLQGAIDDLSQAGDRVLVLMDGFDAVLAADQLTRNLWDNLLDLARRPGLRLVTASRRRLRELLKHNARPSIFWEIFSPNPVVLGAFAADEVPALTDPFAARGITFDASAKKELLNETGGHPVLLAALLSALFEATADDAALAGTAVKECAASISGSLQEVFADIWDECCAIEAGLAVGQLAQGDLAVTDISPELSKALCARGLAMVKGSLVRSGSRMFAAYAREQAPRAANLVHLFGSARDYDQNIRGLLQLRIAQAEGLDPALKDDIVRAITDLVPEPRHSINCMRTIALRALSMIWHAELDVGGQIPESWINEWKYVPGRLAQDVVTNAANGDRRLPGKTGRQCGLLNLATGTQDVHRVTRYVSRQTYLLLDHIQSVGDYGQHQTEAVDIGLASAACLSAIELARKLAAELPST